MWRKDEITRGMSCQGRERRVLNEESFKEANVVDFQREGDFFAF